MYDGVNDALTDAENASNAANNAQLTANNKARVFYQTTAPTSGMRTNDLWVDGENIYRYSGSIWSGGTAGVKGQPPTDPTFSVDSSGNVISNGTITANDAILLRNGQAGITGYGTSNSSIRFWAGGLVPESADFRVDQSGDVNVRMLNAMLICLQQEKLKVWKFKELIKVF